MKSEFLRSCILVAGTMSVSCSAFAQTTPTATYLAGASNSAYSLSLGNYYSFNMGYSTTYLGFNMRPGNNAWTMGTDGGNNGGSMITSNVGGTLFFITVPTANGGSIQTLNDTQVIQNSRMQINSNGQIQIGLHSPSSQSDYRLSVEGKIVSQSLYVTTPSSWADFVFAPAYKPMSLPKLESYLLRNKHLPAIPSAKEVADKGYNVTEMDAKLLQSVEELTLHVIKLNRQLNKLSERNTQMQSKIVLLQRHLLNKRNILPSNTTRKGRGAHKEELFSNKI